MRFTERERRRLFAYLVTGDSEDLNSDIHFDVLSRLPTKYLPRLKSVSTGWYRLISDPIFMKVQSQKREQISGFFFQQTDRYGDDDITTISYIPVKEHVYHEYYQTVFNFLLDQVVVLSSCNGLVCCRSCYPFGDPFLYVCNPLNKGLIRLKWDDPNKETSFALAFDPCGDPTDATTKFKLIRVNQFETEQNVSCFSFEIYSSYTGVWKKSEETCKSSNNLYKNKGVYVDGVLHWLTDGDEVLTFNVENEISWLVSVPLPAPEFRGIPAGTCIGESEDKLHYILISQHGLHVWFLEDYVESRWSLKVSKTLEKFEEEHFGFLFGLRKSVTRDMETPFPRIELLAFKDGYLLMRVSPDLLLYNIEANEMRHVCLFSNLGDRSLYNTVLPYTLSLVPLNQA